MDHETAGDPVSGLQWTRRSTAKVADQLCALGIDVCPQTVARLLKAMGYSLRVNHKKLAGASHPRRDDHGRGQRSRGDRHVGRQPERPRQLRGSSSARDRSGDARPSGVSVHARRRRRRRGVRVRQPRRVASKFAVVAAGVGNRVRTVPQLHGAAARSPHRRPAWPLCVSTADGPRQRRPGLRTVGEALRPTRPRGRPQWGEDWGPRFRVGLRGANVDSDAYPPVPGRRRESTVRAGAANADAPGKGLSANQG